MACLYINIAFVNRMIYADNALTVDLSAHRLEVAKTMGADYTYLVDPSSADTRGMAQAIIALMGSAPDVTIECTGAETSLQTGIYVKTLKLFL